MINRNPCKNNVQIISLPRRNSRGDSAARKKCNFYVYWMRCRRGGKFRLTALLRQADNLYKLPHSSPLLLSLTRRHHANLKTTTLKTITGTKFQYKQVMSPVVLPQLMCLLSSSEARDNQVLRTIIFLAYF